MADAVSPLAVATDQETRAEADSQPQSSQFWLGEIGAALKRDDQWWKRAKRCISRFRDERERELSSEKRVNILWSNTEILKAALFNGLGHPDVRQRFPKKGRDERAARTAALVLERALTYCQEAYNAASAVECAVEDMLLAGRGTVWAVYEADLADEALEGQQNAAAGDLASEQAGIGHNGGPAIGDITEQRCELHHVYWQDFLTSAGRKWADVWWVARGHVYSRDELVANFGEEAGAKVPLGAELDMGTGISDKNQKNDTFKRARVWEIWDKSKKQRIYVAEGYEWVLKADADPYRLQGFYPCPEPLYGVKTTSSLTPIPEYTLYQDQADELDQITTRLHNLIEALKRRGVYDATSEGADNQLSQLMNARDNQFVPYKGFAVLMEKGGLAGVFQTENLEPIIKVIQGLYQQRTLLVQAIYETTGISDMMRGATNANETATAQRMKGQFGSLRLTSRQKRVAYFIRDSYRIKAELMAEHYTREKLQEMTGIDMPDKQEIQQAQAVMQQVQAAQQIAQSPPGMMLGMQRPMPQINPAMVQDAQATLKAVPWDDIASILRSDARRGYKIDVESEASSELDDVEEKSARIEFITSMQGYLERAIPAVMQVPPLLPLVRELTTFGVKAFKVGRSMEEAFEDAFDQLGQMAAQGQGKPPADPKAEAEAEKLKAETESLKVESQALRDRTNAEVAVKAQKAKIDADAAGRKAQVDIAQAQAKHATAVAELQHTQAMNNIERHTAMTDLHAKIASIVNPVAPIQ